MSKPENLPTKIRILSTDFEIQWLSRTEMQEHNKFGYMSANTQRIGICYEVEPSKMACTFLHEILHAIHWLGGAYEFTYSIKEPKDIEEFLAHNYSNLLQAVILQNPEVFIWYVNTIFVNYNVTKEKK